MSLARGDELAHRAVDVARLAAILLEGDAAEGEAGAHVVDQDRPLLPVGISLLDRLVGGERPEELRRAEHVHIGHELALEVVLDFGEHVVAVALDVAVGVGKIEVDRRLGEAELGVEVVDGAAVGIEDLALECPHAQVFQGDGVLVAHGFQVACHHAGNRLHLRLRAEGADALDFLGQHDVVVRDVGDDEGAQGARAALAHGARRARRFRRQQVQPPGVLLDDDLPGAHRLGRKETQLLDAAVAVGDEVDGRGEARHREAGVVERILHLGSPK